MDLRISTHNRQVWDDAIESWGPQHQMTMANEEAGELIQALAHFERGRCGIEKVIEEFGDLFVCAGQVVHDHCNAEGLETAEELRLGIKNAFAKLQLKLAENDKNFGEGR